jgi:HD-like signal output (HDOD) protein
MNIKCQVCNAVFKIKDGIVPPGKKITYTCRNCRPGKSLPQGQGEPTRNEDTAAGVHGVTVCRPTGEKSNDQNKLLKEKILTGVQDLPPMPKVVMEIHDQISGADINTKKIADLIETDQAIASKVLRLANSAYYGLSGRISTIQSALTLLGLKGLLEVVSMAGCEKLLTGRLPGYGYDTEDLWRHSLAVAYGCKILATSIDPGISDIAHLAGLIHDAGKLILDRFVAERKAEFEIFMEREQKSFLDAETVRRQIKWQF